MEAARSYPKSTVKHEPKSYNVLLVEDEGLIARDIAQRVEALGHQVSSIVSTGEEAIEAAPGADIVLMDIRLDGPMDGIEAAQNIRRRFHIPVIFLTAHADRSMVERAKQAEPFGYIVKPVAPAALHTCIEIAIHKHAMEREVSEREAWLRAVLISVADAVAVAAADGCVRFLNPAGESLTGWSEAEARGQELGKIVPLVVSSADSRRVDVREGPVALALLRDAVVPLDRHTQLMNRGGHLVPVEGTAAPVRVAPANPNRAAIGAVLTFRDVSRRRWEEQQMRQAQQVEAAANLAAGVAGEYTNLLAVIRGQAERLLDQFGDFSPARQAAEEIRQAASAAEQITRKLAGFGKRQPTQMEVLSPNAVLRRMAKLLETVSGNNEKIVMKPGLLAGKIKADGGQLEQLLMNLTMHAGRKSGGSGEILIETGPASGIGGELAGVSEDYVRIAVWFRPISNPTGPDGIDLSLDPGSVEDESLALSTAHNIVREHNGFLSVRTAGTGEAAARACLEVLLPRWTEPKGTEKAPPPLTHVVVLVEPREIVRAELHKFFETNGLDLLEAVDAAEAIALAEVREGPLELVIAPAAEAERISRALSDLHSDAEILRIVDGAEQNSSEIQRSYTQAALLERVLELLGRSHPVSASAGICPG
jgi:two-component system cell cycle sensor histidine kinase/response regulator CckA